MTTVLKWAWRHGCLEVEQHDDLDDAVRSAGHASDYGDEALECLEIVGDRIVTQEEVWELREAQEEEEHKNDPPYEQPQFAIKVRSPADKFALWSSHVSEDKFVASLDKAVSLLGHDRVQVLRRSNDRWVEVA